MYPLEAVAVLSIISGAQQAGFSLDEIRQVLPEDFASWRHDEQMAALTKKVSDIDCKENADRVMASLNIPKR